MRILCLLSIIFYCTQTLSAQSFKISKDALQFPNGEVIDRPINRQTPVPLTSGANKIYADYSNGIVGDVTDNSFLQHGEIFGFQTHLYREPDATGRPGAKVLKPLFTITKPLDAASADLLNSFANNSIITEIKFKLLVIDSGGTNLVETFRVTVANVKITDHRYKSEYDPESGSYFVYETYNLHYGSISFNNYESNGSATVN